MGARSHAWVLALAALLTVGCGVAREPVEETESSRDPALERFWENFRAASTARGAGDPERAAGFYEQALAADPDHGDTLYYLGHFRYARSEVAAALEHFERLAQVEPDSLRSWQQLSLVRGQSRPGWVGDLGGAEIAARRAVDVVRTESLNYELLARWSAYRAESSIANEHITTALGHNQKSEAARLLREWLERPSRADNVAGASALAMAARHTARRVDLDADGAVDLTIFGVSGGSPVLVAGTGGDRRVLPSAARVPAWADASKDSVSGPFPVPTRAAFTVGPYGERVVLVGGGSRGARVYEAAGESYREIDNVDLPALVGAPLVVAADFDGDDIDDLLLANIRFAADSQALGGRVFLGRSDGSFRASEVDIPGPLVQLAAADIDGDGDADVIVGRPGLGIETEEVAGDHAPPLAAAATTEISVLINDDGRLSAASIETPGLGSEVRDIVVADLDRDGRTDLFFATASWSPERSVADVLWLGTTKGFVDSSDRLGPERFGSTFRAWPAAGGLVLVRGGAVPGDPRHTVLLQIR